MVGAPVVGVWTTRHGIFKPIIWLIVPFFVGNFLYAVANEWWEVLIARFIVGLSATVSTVVRAWVRGTIVYPGHSARRGLSVHIK